METANKRANIKHIGGVMTDNISSYAVSGYFVMVPEWVLYLPVSASAIRVYAVIRRHADVRTGQCFPSRRLIAHKAQMSVATVDRSIKELVTQGAMTVRKRKTPSGDWSSNLYFIHALPTNNPQVAAKLALPSVNADTTGGHIIAALTKPITNEKQEHAEYTSEQHNHCSLGSELFHSGATLKEVELVASETGAMRELVIGTYVALCSLHKANPQEGKCLARQ